MKSNRQKKFKRNHRKWDEKEMEQFNNFIKEHEHMLVSILYKNINKGMHIFRKTNGFFQKMSEKTNRSAAKCKSKFQKHEKKIYCDLLSVPKNHYQLFNYLRRHSLTDDSEKDSKTSKSNLDGFLELKKLIDTFIEENGLKLEELKGKNISSTKQKEIDSKKQQEEMQENDENENKLKDLFEPNLIKLPERPKLEPIPFDNSLENINKFNPRGSIVFKSLNDKPQSSITEYHIDKNNKNLDAIDTASFLKKRDDSKTFDFFNEKSFYVEKISKKDSPVSNNEGMDISKCFITSPTSSKILDEEGSYYFDTQDPNSIKKSIFIDSNESLPKTNKLNTSKSLFSAKKKTN